MSRHTIAIQNVAFVLFLLLIFSLAFMKPALSLGVSAITPTDLLFPIVFAAWIASIAFGGLRFSWTNEYWSFVFYFLALSLSALFSTNVQLSFQKLPVPFYLILLAVMTVSMITTRTRMRLTLLVWLAASGVSAAAALLAIALFYLGAGGWLLEILTSHSGAVPVRDFPRVSSTFVTPAMFGNFLTVSVVMALASQRVGWIGRFPASVLIAALVISAILSLSLALGGFFLAIGVWLAFDARENKLVGRVAFGMCVFIALVSLVIAPFALPAGFWSSGDFSAIGSDSSRQLVWREAFHTFLSRPFTGSGIGTAAANVLYRNYDGSLSLLTDAHNIFLSVAAQAGVVGLVSILVLMGTILKTALSPRAATETGTLSSAFAIAFMSAFVFEGLTGSYEDARHLWVLMGLIIAARKIESNSERSSTSLHST